MTDVRFFSSITKNALVGGKIMTFLYCICFSMLFTVSAYADYIDPSAVTYTAQAIAAVVVAIGALITVFRHKIVAFFKKDKGEAAKREIHLKDDSAEEEQK